MTDLETILLVLLLAISLGSLLGAVLLWLRQDALTGRIVRIEAVTKNAVSHQDVVKVYEDLAFIKGQLQTTNQLMLAVQKHLLEKDQ